MPYRKEDHLKKMISVLGAQYFSVADLTEELWLPLLEWKNCKLKYPYTISNKGRVRDFKGQIVPGNIDPYGYHCISLIYASPKDTKHSFVHSLVLTSFVGPPPRGMVKPTVQHKDHNPLNNKIDNLEWMEADDNSKDAAFSIKVKITDKHGVHIFESKEEAGINYCGKSDNYINDCMNLSIPVTDKFGNIVNVSYLSDTLLGWVDYTPTRLLKPWKLRCIINDSTGCHEFQSISAATKYLNQKDFYIQYHRDHNLPIVNKVTGEQVSFKLLKDIDKEEN